MLTEPLRDDPPVNTPPGPEALPVLRSAFALMAALQFLTIVPPIVRRPFTAAEMGRAVGFFPLVVLII